jgi:hypothetical protein
MEVKTPMLQIQITAAADENGDYYEICTCPEGVSSFSFYPSTRNGQMALVLYALC